MAVNCDYTGRLMARTKGPRVKQKKTQKKKREAAPKNGWTSKRRGGLRILQVAALAKLPWLTHGFSTREGGVSKLEGKRVLNLGFTEWDTRENVRENRRKLQAAVGAEEMKLT